jgi:hypothetical protein
LVDVEILEEADGDLSTGVLQPEEEDEVLVRRPEPHACGGGFRVCVW